MGHFVKSWKRKKAIIVGVINSTRLNNEAHESAGHE